jgi:hypothetical protein
MTLGLAPNQADVFESTLRFCGERVSPTSIYGLLYREAHRLFPDQAFADLFSSRGRACVPPRVVAVVMVLQRIEGLSDREAVDRFTFDLRWKFAAGGLDFHYSGFVHTVLVDMRARLRDSERPNRIFEAVLDVAKNAGLVGRKRVLDSTALYDAVATMDTVTLIRSAVRGVLNAADVDLAVELRRCCRRDDDYAGAGKPVCDWDDEAARSALVDELARDAHAIIAHLHGKVLAKPLHEASELLATVVGQDLEKTDDGQFRIAHRVAKDRIISTVDPEARHGHKTAARGFDGYKGHIAIDPDSEIITATAVTPGNVGDNVPATDLLKDVLEEHAGVDDKSSASDDTQSHADPATGAAEPAPVVYGDASYGTAEIVETIEAFGGVANVKVQPPASRNDCYSKSEFTIDVANGTVRCPAGVIVQIGKKADGGGIAHFGLNCEGCAQRSRCTTSKTGRVVNVHPKEETLRAARERQASDDWRDDYRSTRPKVERKLAHMMFRRHGGRRARVRGTLRVSLDFALLAAAQNLKRLARLAVDLFAAPVAA